MRELARHVTACGMFHLHIQSGRFGYCNAIAVKYLLQVAMGMPVTMSLSVILNRSPARKEGLVLLKNQSKVHEHGFAKSCCLSEHPMLFFWSLQSDESFLERLPLR